MPKNIPNYQKMTEELQEIMHQLEHGDLDIDQAVTHYERGLQIVGSLEARLTTAENRVAALRNATESDSED